ncbi:MAG: DUF2279 domain-containing protein [Bacteroidota bacterium]
MAANKKQLLHPLLRGVLICFFIAIFHLSASAQSGDSVVSTVNKKRFRTLVIGSGVGYTATMIGLNELWYKDSDRQSFRFFNDNAEWKQVDKIGHFFSGFYFSYGASSALRWCGMTPRKSDLAGAVTGFLVMVPIEIFDGYSDAYGASTGDLIANAAGPAFFLAQQSFWKEIRIHPKFSFQSTDYAAQRPEVLGDNWLSEIFKDYNGQTYWLSVDVDKFMKFPRWLNVAVGYGAEGMLYARDRQNAEIGLRSYRQYYLALDIDLTAVKTRSKALKTLIFLANMIRLPAPGLEFSSRGVRFQALQF